MPHVKGLWFRKNIINRYIHVALILIKKVFQSTRSISSVSLSGYDYLLYVNSKNTRDSLHFLDESTLNTITFSQTSTIYKVSLNTKLNNEIIAPLWLHCCL